MQEVNQQYLQALEAIKQQIQQSDILQKFLEEEEEELYVQLKDTYEPHITQIYEHLAENFPLQIEPFEKALLDEQLEGLFLPKILGYAVLRGILDEHYKYIRPQEHFKDILVTICNSSNFELIKKRIGQTIQVGFALSSDIWVTNLINLFSNKRVKQFLLQQKLPKFRALKDRRINYLRYKNQFKKVNFLTTEFPTVASELQLAFPSVRQFLKFRVREKHNNVSFGEDVLVFLENKDFIGSSEHTECLCLYAHFFEKNEDQDKRCASILNDRRKADEEFAENWLAYVLDLQQSVLPIGADDDGRVLKLLDTSIEDDLKANYELMDVIHNKGFVHDDTITAIKGYYLQQEGLSVQNACVRQCVFNYIEKILDNLDTEDYKEYFELSKIFPIYINIFNNQSFNQAVKEACLRYIKKLQKRYTDKRGKDYQDIKKFVRTTFTELGFMTEKQIVELFKTKRKKKPTVTS